MKTLFSQYNTFLKAKWLLPRSIDYYMWHIEHFFQYTNCNVEDFWDFKKFKKKWYVIIERPTLCNESKKKHLKCARIFADYLVEEDIIEYNAPRNIKPPRVQTSLPIAVEDEEISSVFRAIDRRWTGFLLLRNRTIIETFIYTGLRRNELIELKREHVYIDRIFVQSGKWNKDRTIYIPAQFSEKLQEYMKITTGVSEYVFYTEISPKLSTSTMKRIFSEIRKKCDIKKFHPHRLRHTYASRMLEQWIDLPVVRDQMGHQNIATTNRYIAVRNKHRKKAVENLSF